MEIFNDNSVMPGTGKHAGKRMIAIPAQYLLYIYENGMAHDPRVKQYIIDNLAGLRKEASQRKY